MNVHARSREIPWVCIIRFGFRLDSGIVVGNARPARCLMKLSAHMVGLQERMKGPRYDVFGPWPVCPDNIVRAYGGY